jgi:hypothetical protein
MATQYPIVSGPSKFDIMMALFDWSIKKPRLVKFDHQCRRESLTVSITSVMAEDGSGESWIVEGNVSDEKLTHYKAYYRTDTRRGWIKY